MTYPLNPPAGKVYGGATFPLRSSGSTCYGRSTSGHGVSGGHMYDHGTPRQEARAHQAMCVREILLGIVKELEDSGDAEFNAHVVTESIPNRHACHFDVLVQLYVDACKVLGVGADELRKFTHDAVHAYLNAP